MAQMEHSVAALVLWAFVRPTMGPAALYPRIHTRFLLQAASSPRQASTLACMHSRGQEPGSILVRDFAAKYSPHASKHTCIQHTAYLHTAYPLLASLALLPAAPYHTACTANTGCQPSNPTLLPPRAPQMRRLGCSTPARKREDGPLLWIHAGSVGACMCKCNVHVYAPMCVHVCAPLCVWGGGWQAGQDTCLGGCV